MLQYLLKSDAKMVRFEVSTFGGVMCDVDANVRIAILGSGVKVAVHALVGIPIQDQ